MIALVAVLSACGGGEPVMEDPLLIETRPKQNEIIGEQMPPTMAVDGTAGNPSGPGVEPPSTPTPEPPERSAGLDAMDGSGAMGGNPSPSTPDAMMDNGEGLSASAELACTLAVRLDTCCLEVVAATPDEIIDSECLVAYQRGRQYPPALVESCQRPLAQQCAVVRCAAPRPPSRAVQLDDNGSCGFVDECQSVADCTIGSDHEGVCACLSVWPRSWVDEIACLVEQAQPVPAQCEKLAEEDCSCPEAPVSVACVDVDGLRVCR